MDLQHILELEAMEVETMGLEAVDLNETASSTESSFSDIFQPLDPSAFDLLPPFLSTSVKHPTTFIDQGNAELLTDDFSVCCEVYFYWCHGHKYSSDRGYPKSEFGRNPDCTMLH
jgi:hypothetical protein